MSIYFIILLTFTYTTTTCQNIIDYQNGRSIDDVNVKSHTPTENCNCDLTDSCDYLCCCDKDCVDEARDYWEKHLTCIDEKDSVGIFADRCIDENLIWSYNERRGLKRDIQTEDVKKKENAVIYNWCFSIDNNGNENLEQPEDVEKDFGINYNEAIIFEDYFEKKILKHYFKSDYTANKNNNNNNYNKKLIRSNGKIFSDNENFMLFSGADCSLTKTVEISKSVNASCIMSNQSYHQYFDNIDLDNYAFNNEINCTCWKTYNIVDSYLDPNGKECLGIIDKSYKILEIEFILEMAQSGNSVTKCRINKVISNDNIDGDINFKNSVKFVNSNFGWDKLPYRYSGNVGYLNNLPLKIYFENDNQSLISNEFFLVGKASNYTCRNKEKDNFLKYLYNIDKPLLFGEEYSYSCNYNGMSMNDTTLYRKIKSIIKIGRYGSSYHINSKDWVYEDSNLNNCKDYENTSGNNIIITMEIRVTNIALKNNAYKTISGFKITCTKDEKKIDNLLTFKIKYRYITEENNDKFKEEPKIPHFIPKLPSDLLDPLKTSDVKK